MEKIETDLKQLQKSEAIKRLEILNKKGLVDYVTKDFKKNDLLYYSEQTRLGGILYWCTKENGAENYLDKVKDFEKEHNAVVYHVIHCYTTFGEILNLMYVSENQEEWEQDRQDLEENYSFTYCYNLDDEWCSEFGSIGIGTRAGGIIRTC